MNIYSKNHTINVWVKIISEKFNDLDFNNRENELALILNITSKAEIKKIKEASFIVFGRKLGVESFEDACIKLGQSTILPSFIGLNDELSNKFISEYKLTIIIKALNEGWYPNWGNSGEYKYIPYFNMTAGGLSFWNSFLYY